MKHIEQLTGGMGFSSAELRWGIAIPIPTRRDSGSLSVAELFPLRNFASLRFFALLLFSTAELRQVPLSCAEFFSLRYNQ